MVTQQELRRAIYWADRYVLGLNEYINWGGKTYAVTKGYKSGFPLTLKTEHPPSADEYRYQVLGHPHLSWSLLGPQWHPTQKLLESSTNGQTWNAKIQFGFTYLCYVGDQPTEEWAPVADFDCTFEPEAPPSGVVVAEITPTAYYRIWKSDAYFFNPLTRKSERLIADVGANVGKTFTVRSNPFEGFPRLRYWGEETLEAAHYIWNCLPAERSFVRDYMVPFINDFGYSINRNSPFFLLSSDNIPDECTNNLYCKWDMYHTCDVYGLLPLTEGAMSHFCTMCIKCMGVDARWWGIDTGLCPMDWDCGMNAHRALHLLFRKRDPKYKEKVCLHWFNPLKGMYEHVEVENSAEDYLINGYTSIHTDVEFLTDFTPLKVTIGKVEGAPPVINALRDASTWTEGSFWAGAQSIVALAVLGYGFNYPDAQDVVDKYVDWAIKNQWGYPFNSGEEGYGRYNGYGKVWRPDLTGGFFLYGKDVPESSTVREGYPPPVPPMKQAAISQFFGWGMPGEIGPPLMDIWNEYGGVMAAIALRVYEYYKYRLKV
jgi:hypothetical protein